MRDNELPDIDLLARARSEPEVLGVIYEHHAAAVFRYLARRVGYSAAEDLLGEVFAAAVAARLRVQPHLSGSALPWLYGRHARRSGQETESRADRLEVQLPAAWKQLSARRRRRWLY